MFFFQNAKKKLFWCRCWKNRHRALLKPTPLFLVSEKLTLTPTPTPTPDILVSVASLIHTNIAMLQCMYNCSVPKGLEDVSKYPALIESLKEAGTWSELDLKRVMGLNFLRVFQQVEAVRTITVYVYVRCVILVFCRTR
jgi:hypothetical protein